MGTGDWVTPRRTEVVYESERTRVTRLFYPDRTLIRKEPLGPDAERRLEHETAVLAGLHGIAGLAQLAEVPWYPGSVLLIDAGRVNLAGSVKPMAADDLIWLALRLARALAQLHDQQVLHRDLNPANIVVSDDGGDPCLVGFTRATPFGQIRREFTSHGETAATTAYQAPELTGRTARTVDQRADLYGLGATLYELATGSPPFGDGPASRLPHDHPDRIPVPPAQVAPGLPAPLSAIIMHLLEKDPDNRYQSANGVLYDLVALSRHEVLPADTAARLAAFNELVGTALAHAETSAQVTASRARVLAAADQARRRIERDLHDGAQQRLVSLALQLREARAAVPPELGELAAELDRAVITADSALDEVGEIARGIHPAILTSGGLRPAVRALAHRSPIPIRLEECPDDRLPEQVEVTAYYVIAEALTNATKHAQARTASIRAELAGQRLIITIDDDGVGGADPADGTGLTGLKDRVAALGGVMRIESPPGAGTVLRVELPLAADGGAAPDGRYPPW